MILYHIMENGKEDGSGTLRLNGFAYHRRQTTSPVDHAIRQTGLERRRLSFSPTEKRNFTLSTRCRQVACSGDSTRAEWGTRGIEAACSLERPRIDEQRGERIEIAHRVDIAHLRTL